VPDTQSEDLKDRIVHYAEQLGRLVGTVKGKTDDLLDHNALAENLKSIRDGAADLLKELTPPQLRKTSPARKASSKAVQRDPLVAAPGKRHRAHVKSARGVKHSDQRISRLKAATMKGPRRGRG